MLQKLRDFSLLAYVTGFLNDFKRDERGLSGVVVTVLLILVAVLAVVLIWSLLGDWIENTLWPSIIGEASNIN